MREPEKKMMIQIKNRYTDQVIFEVEAETLRETLQLAAKSGADLYGANLYGANLYGVKNLNKFLTTALYILLEQPSTVLHAYKLTKKNGEGPFNGGIIFNVGQEYEQLDADCDENEGCGKGINIATLDWCLKEWRQSYKIFVVSFQKSDIAAIPIGSDGKFRVKKCKIVREIDLRAELNWPPILEEKIST